MTEKQKFDAVLNRLYELHKTKQEQSLEEIFESFGIYDDRLDVWDMARRLEKRGFITYTSTQASTDCYITAEGRDYVENPPAPQDSSSKFVANVSGGANVIINQASANTTINQNFQGEAQKLIDQFKIELEKVSELNQEELRDLRECIEEIESKVRQQEKVPRYTFKTLLSGTANLATLGSLAIQIAQVLDYLPKSM